MGAKNYIQNNKKKDNKKKNKKIERGDGKANEKINNSK